MTLGHAPIQQGPISSTVSGYWPEIKEIGYKHNLTKAGMLLENAGYTYNNADVLEKDGHPLQLILLVSSAAEELLKLASILKEQFKTMGVDIKVETKSINTLSNETMSGHYSLYLDGWDWPDSSLMFGLFHSSMLGTTNRSQVNDPELDRILEEMVYTANAETNRKAAYKAQSYIVENAIIIPFYTPTEYSALNNRIKDSSFSLTGNLILFDAYIDTK